MFPHSWPGVGLLLLRLIAAASLLSTAYGTWWLDPSARSPWRCIAIAIEAALLGLGLVTPATAMIQALIEAADASEDHALLGPHVVLATIGLSIILLGPGAWSLDAVVFGRRRIDLNGRD